MKEPMLVVLAAGMGSRYGGLKQIDPIGPHGEVILNYTCFDAMRAGFKRFVFIIKEEMAEDFKRIVGDRLPSEVEVHYVFQSFDDVPQGIEISSERSKPLGTTHAMYCTRNVVDAPFAILNADDFYGEDAFKKLYEHLTQTQTNCMIGYELDKTLTDHGTVTRGVCVVENHHLKAIEECAKIARKEDGVYYEQQGTWIALDPKANVSMNMWGFQLGVMNEMVANFKEDLASKLAQDPLKGEVLLPVYVGGLLKEQKIDIEVLSSEDAWFGVTYQEDKVMVKASIQALIKEGKYPETLTYTVVK